VTLMTDLSDPARPQILTVERGRDSAAALKCLDRLTKEQHKQIGSYRVSGGLSVSPHNHYNSSNRKRLWPFDTPKHPLETTDGQPQKPHRRRQVL
jgi:hypothetical protein